MSNSIYNILNNFNKVAQEPVAPATTKTETKTKLHESMEQVISEKYMGFKKTVAAVKKGGSAENPEAVAAAIGRKKYGKEKFQKAAAQGKKLGVEEANMEVDEQLNPALSTPALDKIVANKAAAVKRGDSNPQADYDKAFSGAYSRDEQGQKKYSDRTAPGVINKIKDTFGWDKPDPAYGPKSAAPAQSTNEADMEEGNEFTGALARAKASGAKDFKVDGKTFKVDEVALPGAKAERMIKHVKKGYAKDGKLTPKEKSIAYATAWKAHKAGKVEEAVNALKTLSDAGMTRDQIVEGWEDMMKATKARAADQGTGKFDKKKTSTGTVYTRKYNPKSGETDDTENVSVEKRGRGRPKKSAFENVGTIDKMIAESFGELFENPNTAPIQPKDAAKFMASSDPKMFDKLAGKNAPAAPAPKAGTITKGVWTADAPKPGQKPVPVPQGLDEVDAEMEGMRKLAGLKGVEEDATTNAPPMPVRTNSSNNAMRDAWIEKYGKTHNTIGTPKEPGMTPSDDQSAAEIGRLSNVAGMNAAGKRVPGIPVTKNTSNYAMRDAWMSKYGQSHNADGTPKSMSTNEANMEVDEQLNPALSTPTLDKIAANRDAAVKRGDASAQANYDKSFVGAYSADEQGQKKYSDRTAPGVINKIKDTFGLDKPNTAYGPKAAAPAQSTNEADMEEGNAFSGAVARAKADGVQPGEKIKVGGKEYDLKEGDDALNQMRKMAGLKECGMSPIGGGAVDMRKEEGQTNISTNQSSDGTKSVTISASGDAASSLMQMLKLAGLGGQSHEAEPQGVMVVSTDGDEEVDENLVPVPNPSGASSAADAKRLGSMMPAPAGEKDPIATKEAKDERYHASTTPDEEVKPVQALTKGGNGEVAGQEKKMTPNGYKFSDNPMAMKEGIEDLSNMGLDLIKAYESIKLVK